MEESRSLLRSKENEVEVDKIQIEGVNKKSEIRLSVIDRNNEVLGVVEDSKEWEKEKEKEEERRGSVIGGIMMVVTSIFVFGLANRDSEGSLSGTSPFYILAILLVATGLFLLVSGLYPSVFESIDNILT